MSSKVLVVIPAYNEENTLAEVVRDVKEHFPEAHILVVNDGSADRTSQKARDEGAAVIDLPYNLGIGVAVQTGYKFAREMGYSLVVQVDADGQHPADQIAKLIGPISNQQADMVIGSRFSANKALHPVPLARRLGMFILRTFISLVVRQRIKDSTSGFRAVNEKVVKLFAKDYPLDYLDSPEAIVLVHRAGFKIREVPVSMKPRLGGASSITPGRAIYYMIKVLLALMIGLFKKKPKFEERSEK